MREICTLALLDVFDDGNFVHELVILSQDRSAELMPNNSLSAHPSARGTMPPRSLCCIVLYTLPMPAPLINPSESNEKRKTNERKTIFHDLFLAIRLAWDLGWIIAIPAVALGFGGAYIDKYLGTSPLFLLLGLGLAMSISGYGLYRKFSEILLK